MNFHLNLLATLLLVKVYISDQLKSPSFISQWYDVVSLVTGDLIIEHGFNDLPVKVDVQIKVIKSNEEFIFSGTGTGQRDNDYDVAFGGIVYRYNSVHVVLYTTYTGLGSNVTCGIAFTGNTTYYDGPSSARGLYRTGHARVRAWKTSDFPMPLFYLSIDISSESGVQFKEQDHWSTVLPDIVIAQVLLDDGYISEGQGNIFQSSSNDHHNTLSGLVFGYNQQKVQIWVPTFIQSFTQTDNLPTCNGVLYAHNDGWGKTDVCKLNGNVKLKGYQLSKAFQTSFPAGRNTISNSTINFQNIYSIDTALVTVQVKQDDTTEGNNEGMIFSGVGSAMPTSMIYSGVVYVYTDRNALLYTPTSTNDNGYMIYLGDRWGNGQGSTNSRTANVTVTVFSTVCPDPSVPNSVNNLTNGLQEGSVVQYSCDSGYVYTSGYLTRTCSSGVWDGMDPVCTKEKCKDPGQVSNATYTYTGLSVGSTVTYVCVGNFSYEAGNLVRTCLSGGIWDGVPPVCSEQNCKDPGPVSNANYTYTGLMVGSTVTYVCEVNFLHKAGNNVRTCLSTGTWNGMPPVCLEQNCMDPGPVSNANYRDTGLHVAVGSTVTYSCDASYIHGSGDLVRSCQSNGTWSGMPPVCLEQKCKDPGVVSNANYTYTGLSVGSTVSYSCVAGFSCKAGDLVRTCQLDNTWDGIPPVCQELKCNDPGEIYNATYNVTGLSPQNTATYTCYPGSRKLAGDAVRTCQANGTWSGMPIVCIEAPTGSVSVPVTHTTETLAESMEQTKKELTVDKKGTSAYYRRHTSAYDPRPSAFYIGTAGVVLLCSVVAALVLPDFITLFRHMRNFTDIYRN